VYTNNTCSAGARDAGTKTVLNGIVPDSNGLQFNSAGTFYWQAVYSGDANNNGATSVCTSEQLVVNHPPVSQTLPTNTTCSQFVSGSATSLTSAQYSLKGNPATINQVNPGVFFYFVTVQASAGSNTFTITQSITNGNVPPNQLFGLAGANPVSVFT